MACIHVCAKQLCSGHRHAVPQVIEFESNAMMIGHLGLRVSLIAYPVVSVKKVINSVTALQLYSSCLAPERVSACANRRGTRSVCGVLHLNRFAVAAQTFLQDVEKEMRRNPDFRGLP